MKAIVQDRYGPTDALELRDIDPPRIAADDDRRPPTSSSGSTRAAWSAASGTS